MENVFALTSMEKGVGRGWNGPRLQRGCVERGGPWRLLAAHQTCSPDRMVFVRAEAEEGGTIRMSGASSAPGKFGAERELGHDRLSFPSLVVEGSHVVSHVVANRISFRSASAEKRDSSRGFVSEGLREFIRVWTFGGRRATYG